MLCKETDCMHAVEPCDCYCRNHGGSARARADEKALADEIRINIESKRRARDPEGLCLRSPRRFYRGADTRLGMSWSWRNLINSWNPPKMMREAA